MSRYLNGKGMGFIPASAKAAANPEIWAGGGAQIKAYREAEAQLKAAAASAGASVTIIRAGTLKGGASGDTLNGGGGEPRFLNTPFYELGQQDISNWRLLYDANALGVKLVKGDTLPGPGMTAVLTATTEAGGDGDSHRGAVATALVTALRRADAEGKDFSVASEAARTFPTAQEWDKLFEQAA